MKRRGGDKIPPKIRDIIRKRIVHTIYVIKRAIDKYMPWLIRFVGWVLEVLAVIIFFIKTVLQYIDSKLSFVYIRIVKSIGLYPLLGGIDYKLTSVWALYTYLTFVEAPLPTIILETPVAIVLAGISFLFILTSRAVLPRYRLDHLIFVNWYVLVFSIFLGLVCTFVIMSI